MEDLTHQYLIDTAPLTRHMMGLSERLLFGRLLTHMRSGLAMAIARPRNEVAQGGAFPRIARLIVD